MTRFHAGIALVALGLTTPGLASTPRVNPFLQLPVYPQAQLVSVESGPSNTSQAWLRTNATLTAVYDFYHQRLTAARWVRGGLERYGSTKLEAHYQRDAVRFKFEIERVTAGEYKLEFDFRAKR